MADVQRTLGELQAAAEGLEEAIESLEAIAQHPQTPYPKHDVEQRANMARNTMRKQLERAIQSQKEYEEKNAEKLQAAKLAREAELKKREDMKRAAEEAEQERKQKIAEERQRIAERDRELAEARAEEDRAREEAEMTTDSETGEKVNGRRSLELQALAESARRRTRRVLLMMSRRESRREEAAPSHGVAVQTATKRNRRRRDAWLRSLANKASTR